MPLSGSNDDQEEEEKYRFMGVLADDSNEAADGIGMDDLEADEMNEHSAFEFVQSATSLNHSNLNQEPIKVKDGGPSTSDDRMLHTTQKNSSNIHMDLVHNQESFSNMN